MVSTGPHRALGILVTALGIIGLSASCTRAGAEEQFRYFTIGTAATGGTYFPIGALIATVISNPPGSRPCIRGGSCGVPGLIAVAQSTEGSLENVERLGPQGLQSILVQADVAAWAYAGTGIFEERWPKTNLRAIASLYPEDVHIVVRRDSGIRTVQELRGKRVSLGGERSGTRVEALIILEQFGLTQSDVVSSFSPPGLAADRLERGDIDAFFHISGSPVAAVAELSERVAIDLLPIPRDEATELVARHPFFSVSSTPPGNYKGVGLVPTLSVGAVWATDDSVDDELVYQVTKALWNPANRALLDAGHPKGIHIQLKRALDGLGIPLHRGARRYYREVGLLD